jgi:hypothetical protein
LRRSIELAPHSAHAHVCLGQALARQGDLAGAEAASRCAQDIDAANASALPPGERLVCSACGESRPAGQYSNTQKKKADGVRKCSGYITSNQAKEAAASVGVVVFEGQQPGEPGALFMAAFALTKPLKMVNRRAVWQAAGGQDWYAFGTHSLLRWAIQFA